MQYETIVAIGQDSHRFVAEKGTFDNPGVLFLGESRFPGEIRYPQTATGMSFCMR